MLTNLLFVVAVFVAFGMSGRPNDDNDETLFSFELLVENIRLDRESKTCDQLALGVRLLDFPTLLVYQPPQSSDPQAHPGQDERGEYVFNRGKCCFFKMNLRALHTQLASSPLYAMVLDVKEEIPKLVGTSIISLAKVMDRIRQDVTEHGASAPSSHGERGLVGICNLTGEKIGSVSLSYKLLSLGASLLPHITEGRVHKCTSVHGERGILERNISTELSPLDCGNVRSHTQDKCDVSGNIQNNKPSNESRSINEDKQDSVCVPKNKPRSQTPQTSKENENSFEEDSTLFCPPHLFYSNSAEEKDRNEDGGRKLLNLNSEAFPFEDTDSEEEEIDENNIEQIFTMNRRHGVKTSSSKETSREGPNVLADTVQQLPLLNALLVELSQLNGQSQQQPLSVHPNLAWIYRPASTEPSAGCGNTASKEQTKSQQKTRQGTSPHLRHLHSPRHCSTPASVKVKGKQEEALTENKRSDTSPKKKLVFGTTRTFNLRLKQISPLKVKQRECLELIQNQARSSVAEGKTRSNRKMRKSSKRKLAFNQSSSLNENIETMIESLTVDSSLQETFTLKQKNLHGKGHWRQDGHGLRTSEKLPFSERGPEVIHIPSVGGDSDAQNKAKMENHSESNQSRSESDRLRGKVESAGSSRRSSPKSSFSDSDGEGNEEADYADDFNSLEPSDAYSPDPSSSPEPCRAKTPRSPVHPNLYVSDSGSEGFQRRAVLPVPVKAPSSPQRALRGTHVIRPRTHTSALSFSSDDGDRDGSLQTVCSAKQMTESGGVGRSSGADSFISSKGQRSESTKNSGPVQGFSAESISSFEPQEAEELEDELGSLDFRKEYQHISKLVANKLPGYTM